MLWIHIDNVNQKNKKGYLKSKENFIKLKNGLYTKDKKFFTS